MQKTYAIWNLILSCGHDFICTSACITSLHKTEYGSKINLFFYLNWRFMVNNPLQYAKAFHQDIILTKLESGCPLLPMIQCQGGHHHSVITVLYLPWAQHQHCDNWTRAAWQIWPSTDSPPHSTLSITGRTVSPYSVSNIFPSFLSP